MVKEQTKKKIIKNNIQIVDKDILQCEESIIVHQTNCQGVMGSGLAKQIKAKYPEVFKGYFHFCKTTILEKIAGNALICEANDGKFIANIFGQINYGKGLQTDYDLLEKGLKELKKFAKKRNLSIAIPYKIGCGLGGGDWDIVLPMINKIFKNMDITIYKLEKKSKN